jgi:DNA invertase Pin-like site-specific DNA recombinase
MNAIYCRVSTDAQAEHGYSIADQIRSCKEHAIKLDLADVQDYIDDGYSGEYLERPALDRLRDNLAAKLVQNVIVYDPDRLSRNLTNQLLIADEIEKAGANLYFITGDYNASPEGRLFFSIRGAISEFERAKIRERSMRGKRSKALSGKMVQPLDAYGYNWDKETNTCKINEQEAANVRLMFDKYTETRSSVRKLTLSLKQLSETDLTVRNRDGKPFGLTHVYRILSNEMYAGTFWAFRNYSKTVSQHKQNRKKRPKEEWIPVTIPPIVTKEQYQEAQSILADNYRRSPRNTKQQYLMRGFVRCQVCGYAMGTRHKHKSNGKEYSWYRCISGNTDKLLKHCGNPSVSSKSFDELIWDTLVRAAKKKKGVYVLIQQQTPFNFTDEVNRLNTYQNELKKKQATILRWFRDGMIQSEDAEAQLAGLRREMEQISSTITGLNRREAESRQKVSPEEILQAKNFEEKRIIIERLGWTVHVDNRGSLPVIRFSI